MFCHVIILTEEDKETRDKVSCVGTVADHV